MWERKVCLVPAHGIASIIYHLIGHSELENHNTNDYL